MGGRVCYAEILYSMFHADAYFYITAGKCNCAARCRNAYCT